MKTRLLGIVGVLVFVSAAIHLALGISGLFEAISGGTSALLPALYLLGGLAAIALLGVIALTPVATTAYVAGVGLMALFLLAYADVHAFGVAESTLGVDLHDHGDHSHAHDHAGHSHDNGHSHAHDGHDHNGEGHSHDHADYGHSHDNGHAHGENGHDHSHDGDTMTVLAEHLLADAYAMVAKTAEAGAAVLFAVLSLFRK